MLDREPKVGDLLSVEEAWFWNDRASSSIEIPITNSQGWTPTVFSNIIPKNSPLLVVETYQHTKVLKVVFLYDGSYYDVSADAANFMRDFNMISSIESKK